MSLVFGDAIVSQLSKDTDIGPLVTVAGQINIYAGYVPNQAPASGTWISFWRISGERVAGHDGDEQLAHPRYQFTIGSANKAQADAVRDLMVKKFNALLIPYTDPNSNQYHLWWQLAGDHEHWDEPLRSYMDVLDFFIWANTEPPS